MEEKNEDENRKEAFEKAKDMVGEDPMGAFQEIRHMLAFPAQIPVEDWSDSWDLFSVIAEKIVGAQCAQLAQSVAFGYANSKALYDFGYELVEIGLPRIAVTILNRADAQEPGNLHIISELSAALDRSGFNFEIVRLFTKYETLLAENFFFRYMNAFAGIMTQDASYVEECLKKYPLAPDGEQEIFMADRIDDFMNKWNTLGTLDEHDLRAWQFVTSSSILLHISPYGFDEGMHGRYAFTQDSDSTCLEGLKKLQSLLLLLKISPPKILAPRERGAEILGRAAASLFNLPFAFFEDDADAAGLVITYDLGLLSDNILEQLSFKKPGQVLFTHAVNWVEPPYFSPDFHTFQYQINNAPWDAKMHFEEDGESSQTPPDESSAEEIAERILNAKIDEEMCIEDENEVVKFTKNLINLGLVPTALLEEGQRPRFWDSSPVTSNRFL